MPSLLSPSEAAIRMGVSTNTLERWRASGEGPKYSKLGHRTIRYDEADILDFIKSHKFQNIAETRAAGALA
jgi:predicted DNA-binding transcriptional regulator AlpA